MPERAQREEDEERDYPRGAPPVAGPARRLCRISALDVSSVSREKPDPPPPGLLSERATFPAAYKPPLACSVVPGLLSLPAP